MWHTTIITEHDRLRLEDYKFEAILEYIVKCCLKKIATKKL